MNSSSALDRIPLTSAIALPPAPQAAESDLSHGNSGGIYSSQIMIVDDEELVVRVVRRFLTSEGYSNFITVTDPRKALEKINGNPPDVVLLDIMMPHVSGIDLMRLRQNDPHLKHIPVIVLSANSEKNIKQEALKLGATDFLSKPVDPVELVLRVQNTLMVKQYQNHLRNYAVDLEHQVRMRTEQIEQSREQIVHCLAKAAEFRDNETGKHVIRVGKYAALIAKHLGFGPSFCGQIELAAQLHDVGKIGIPDSILLNPGKLSREEFEIMKRHCRLGCQIMEPLAAAEISTIKNHPKIGGSILERGESPMLALAATIARTHHEKWDGTGYPDGLKGEEIPIEGRITCVADVFDALCSERPYKPKFPREKCLEIMLSERGARFDPQVLDVFFELLSEVEKIGIIYGDSA